ncbi:NAC domain-containing protein 53-like [Nymphaea colorata]|nr:NAC domain-containing protein 53-like [Nymphaea colorata]
MAKLSFFPGFRFHPTDAELVCFYLRRKICQKLINPDVISELDIYKFAPWDLPGQSCLQSKDLEWYFYCPRDRKYANGSRTNRATEIGYWKTTGKDRPVYNHSQLVGMKKTLVFHVGRAPNGDRTNWVMHEYRLEDKNLVESGIAQDSFVLSKIFEKSGPGPKNGEQYGAPFREEEWNDDLVENLTVPQSLDDCNLPQNKVAENPNSCSVNASDFPLEGLISDASVTPATSHANLPLEYDDIDRILLQLAAEGENLAASDHFDEQPSSKGNGSGCSEVHHMNLMDGVQSSHGTGDVSDIYSGLEDITNEVKPGDFCSVDKFVFPSGSPWLDKLFLEGTYLELNDILGPGHVNSSLLQRPENSCMSDVDQDPLGSFADQNNVPMPLPTNNDKSTGSSINSLCMNPLGEVGSVGIPSEEGHYLGNRGPFASTQQVSEKESTSSFVTAGEGHSKGDNFNYPCSNGGSFLKLQSLLDCFPARPASAAEYPLLLNEGKTMGSSSAHCSSVNALSAVIVNSIGMEELFSHCYDMEKGKKLDDNTGKKNVVRAGYSWRGFSFLAFLGAVSLLIWVSLFILGFKIFGCAWKLILS